MTSTALQKSIRSLRGLVRGDIVLPDDGNYESARTVWNAMADRRPAVIVRCGDVSDVANAIDFAHAHGLELSVRSGGHNIAGHAVCDGGLVVDLAPMAEVRVDAHGGRAYVQPGARLHDVDAATQSYGLAVPLGINSTTGVAGLTLGGGFGWLTRRHGLTIDSLISAEMVTADGRRLRASANKNPDLFWAIRGGGGNFGVVTQFEFRLQPIGRDVLAGLIVFPFAQAARVLEQYRHFVQSAPEDLNVWAVLRKAPPLPFLPASVHGQEVIILAVFYSGEPVEGERLIAPIYGFGSAQGAHVGVTPYVTWQQAFDPLLTTGARNYWKSHNFTALDDGVFTSMMEFAARLPTAECEIFLGLVGGASNRIASDATAYVGRDARFVINVHGRWRAPTDDVPVIVWAREFFRATAPFASTGAYVNFMTDDEGGRVSSAYGSNYPRLVQAKRQYDPENVFHLNQNIKPRRLVY